MGWRGSPQAQHGPTTAGWRWDGGSGTPSRWEVCDSQTTNTQDQRLATADETTPADGIASPLHPLVSQMKLKDTASIWAVHGTVPYSYEGSAGPDGKRQTYHAKRNITLYVAANDVAGVLASATTEMPDLTVWSINHQSRNQNGFAIIVSDEVVG